MGTSASQTQTNHKEEGRALRRKREEMKKEGKRGMSNERLLAVVEVRRADHSARHQQPDGDAHANHEHAARNAVRSRTARTRVSRIDHDTTDERDAT